VIALRLDSSMDMWCGDQSLKEAFPDLFNIARINDDFVADHLE
jgi:hypothetical protein